MQIQRRDGLLSSIFGVLTCGLYSIYFWCRYGEDVNKICAEDGKVTQNFLVAWLLGIITCGIYSMYWLYTLASRLDTASKKYGVNVESPVFFTLFMNIPFLSYFYSCDVMNKFAEKYEEMYPDGNGFGGYVPPTSPNNGGQTVQSVGAQLGAQFKSAVQDVGNTLKSTAQSAMPTCKNCGATIAPGKNYCKKCGYPVNGPAPQENPYGQSNGYVPPMPPMMSDEPISAPEEPPVRMEMPEQSPVQPIKKDDISLEFGEPAINIPTQEEKETKETPQAPICPRCGMTVKPQDKFCIHCGSKING